MDGLGWTGAKLFLVSLVGWVGMDVIFDWFGVIQQEADSLFLLGGGGKNLGGGGQP